MAGRRAAATTLSQLRLSLVERRLRDEPSALDGAESAELATIAVQGVDGLDAYFGRYLPQVVLACVVPVAVLLWVGTIDPVSALVMLLTLPLVPVFMWLIGRYTEEQTRRRWESLRLLSTHFLDVVRGLPTLRAFNRGAAQAEAIADVSDRYRRATMSTLRVAFLSGAVLELAATLGVALVAVTVGVRLVDGGLGLQAGLTVLVLAPELYLPLRRLGEQFHASADGLAVADRLVTLLDAPPAVRTSNAGRPPSPATTVVRLEDVTFSYPARPGVVLDGVTLELRPGETVALVGPSGAGKSTVAKLLVRLAEPTDRRRLGRRHRSSVVRHGGLAPARGVGAAAADDLPRHRCGQHPARGPISRRRGGAGRPRSWRARTHFVRTLPQGYATMVGDGGRALSAGERQRLALARAFLRNAPLVVLDEPTANLDPASAELVADAIEHLREGRTLLVISHRPEPAQRADRVITLEAGRVVAEREAAAA